MASMAPKASAWHSRGAHGCVARSITRLGTLSRYHSSQAAARLHPVAAQRAYAADAADDRRDRRDELVRTRADLEAELRVINGIKER